jgi:hypothetical protein
VEYRNIVKLVLRVYGVVVLMNKKMSQAKDKLAFLPIISCSSKWEKKTKIEPFAKKEPLTFAGELANYFR